ncbi:MAG: HTH-type transcriptional regulator MalT [Candidatus Brocadia fulgida]|nr:HTH-type transcriptional regulator MalT [Candidatus Brocadia fulgida]
MDTGLDYPVTWISAHAGSGKTTLVASYLAARKFPFLWYQVDEGDADIATFFYYMNMAAKKTLPIKRNLSLPLFTPEYLHNISIFTRRYFETLYSALRTPFIIVFDNYQDVPADSVFHEMFVHGLDIIPEGVHVAAISRAEPPSQLARLCANNMCHHIGWSEIKLDPEEFKEIIRMKIPEGLPDETVSQLYAKTEGWAAGLVLMMESFKTKNVDYALLGKLTPEMVFGYFTNETFKKTDRETQIFLLKTSILPRMTVHMAETLTGMSASGRILSRMNQNNYFTAVHHQPEYVYQYHPLFREFLFSMATDTFTREEFLAIQKNASVILEEAGHIEDAAIVFRDARDWDGLVRLILKHAESFIKQGRLKILEEWLTCIPGETTEHTPWLLYWYGICRMPYNPTESRNCFDRAFERFRSQGEQTGMWLSWSYVVDTFTHEFSNFSPMDRYISVFEEIYQEGHVFSTPDVGFRVISCRFISMMMREQYHPEIGKWAGRTLSLLRECKNMNLRLTAGYYLVAHYIWIGDFTNAGVVINTINEGIQPGTVFPLERLLWETTKSAYTWLIGDISSCLRIVSDALKLADETGVHIWDHHLLSHGACASLSSGDTKTAAEFLKRIEPGLVHTRKIDTGFYHLLSAWKELICGNVSSAAEHIKISVDAVVNVDTYFPIASARVTMSQVLAAIGKYGEAFVQLKLAWQIGHRAKSNHIEFLCLLTESHFAIDYGVVSTTDKGRLGEAERTQQERPEDEIPHKNTKERNVERSAISLYSKCPPMAGVEGVDGTDVFASLDPSYPHDNNNPAHHIHPVQSMPYSEITKRGLEVLREAMSLGRKYGIVNGFGWRPDVMPRLCMKALDAGIEVGVP